MIEQEELGRTYERKCFETILGILCQGRVQSDKLDSDIGGIFKRHCGHGQNWRMGGRKSKRKLGGCKVCGEHVDLHRSFCLQWTKAYGNFQNQQHELDFRVRQLRVC